MTPTTCTDPVVLEHWHPLSSVDEMTVGIVHNTVLLGQKLSFALAPDGQAHAWYPTLGVCEGVIFDPAKTGDRVNCQIEYGYVWASLGNNPEPLFPFPEYAESDRRFVPTGMFGVNVSAGRAVENFLDMGHFPYVHTGILGEEPHTEVKEYDVEVSETRDEVLATRCRFYQPQAALTSDEGADVEYTYRVPHPNCAILYKSSPNDPARRDTIFLFIQPVGPESILAHTGMCILDEESPYQAIRYFQQVIFGQDKPILENQMPKRLPLDPRAETPIRADKSAIAYRRWLSGKGLTYGVIPVSNP
ncbi:aromatic ring-hydroxylating dioxygenase subunit alpha [Ruegeria hyattellae]|uniref:aromatic ring-hydroxylating dioxygenase subunit alpha n=1 Tax=Ruegeria hyattellae TaxID=3233337 RepID=UPI00355C4B46